MTEHHHTFARGAYHRCAPKPSENYGIGGVRIYWVLERTDDETGRRTAIDWEQSTPWYLPADLMEEAVPGCTHPHGLTDDGFDRRPSHSGSVGFHANYEPHDSTLGTNPECKWVGGPCWNDAGYMISDEVWRAFLTGGSDAMWIKLGELLDSWLSPAELLPRGES